jgi:hypothetical protein
MEATFNPGEFIANSRLAQLRSLFETGQIPNELLPKTPDDWAAISLLKKHTSSITPVLISNNADWLKQRLPLSKICTLLALEIIPFLRHVYQRTATNKADVRRDHRLEIYAVSLFIEWSGPHF